MECILKCPERSNFCQAIREGDVKSVEAFIERHGPSCLSYSFNFDMSLKEITSEKDVYTTSKNDEVGSGPKVNFVVWTIKCIRFSSNGWHVFLKHNHFLIFFVG